MAIPQGGFVTSQAVIANERTSWQGFCDVINFKPMSTQLAAAISAYGKMAGTHPRTQSTNIGGKTGGAKAIPHTSSHRIATELPRR